MKLNDEIVLLCAFRYALGRMTYVTGAVSDFIIEKWDELEFGKQQLIKAEIREAIKRNRIGMEMDKTVWKRILILDEILKSGDKQ